MEKKLSKKEDNFDSTELRDIIYVFIPSKKVGIKFLSSSPSKALDTGNYETDIYSIEKAEWNDEVNNFKRPTIFRTIQGRVVVNTYIISEQEFLELVHNIQSQQSNRKIFITIPNNKLEKSEDELSKNSVDLNKMHNDFVNLVDLYDEDNTKGPKLK